MVQAYAFLEPQTTIYKWLFQLDDSQSLHRKLLFHQTSIYKWLLKDFSQNTSIIFVGMKLFDSRGAHLWHWNSKKWWGHPFVARRCLWVLSQGLRGMSFRKKPRIFTDSKWLGDWSCGTNYTTGEWKDCSESYKHCGHYGYEPPMSWDEHPSKGVSYWKLRLGGSSDFTTKSGWKWVVWVTNLSFLFLSSIKLLRERYLGRLSAISDLDSGCKLCSGKIGNESF